MERNEITKISSNYRLYSGGVFRDLVFGLVFRRFITNIIWKNKDISIIYLDIKTNNNKLKITVKRGSGSQQQQIIIYNIAKSTTEIENNTTVATIFKYVTLV